MTKLETILENTDPRFEHTIALYQWSTNCDGYNPFQMFLDLIGYTTEHYGQPLFDPSRHRMDTYGYVELEYLADALKEWVIRPGDIEDLITDIIEGELND